MGEAKKFKTVEQYFDSQPEATKQALIELRECIFQAAPDAIEMFS